MAIRKTEDEKQAERQAMERARLTREAEQARAKYLASPIGQAETACHVRGHEKVPGCGQV